MKETITKIRQFVEDREWSQFHTESNIAKSIVIEAAELLENFQWDNEGDIDNIRDELADILIYTIMLCDKYGFDLTEIIEMKIKKNEIKYPIEKSKGNSKKYDEL